MAKGTMKSNFRRALKENLLLVLTIIGIISGFIIGFAIRPSLSNMDIKSKETILMWLNMPGEIFLRLLQMMIIPLVISCIIAGMAALDPKSNGRISVVTVVYVLCSNGVGSLIGVSLGLAMHPGQVVTSNAKVNEDYQTNILETQDIFADLLRNLFPDNIVRAAIQQARTEYAVKEIDVTYPINQNFSANVTNSSSTGTKKEFYKERINTYVSGANMLGMIFFALIFGIATSSSGQVGKPFYHFFHSASELIIIVLRWFLWYFPIGVLFLTAASIAKLERVEETFQQLGMFVAAVMIGLVFHQAILMPLFLFLVTRRNPYLLFYYNFKGWLIAFTTTVLSVCIPEFCHGCEKFGVDSRVARFVVSFAAATSRAGSCCFISCTVLFIAQRNAIELTVGSVLILWLMTTIVSTALPDMPSGSIIIVIIILKAIGLPLHDISALFTVEWLLDRSRTSSNGVSSFYGAVFVHHVCKNTLKSDDCDSKESTGITISSSTDINNEIDSVEEFKRSLLDVNQA